MTRKYYVSEKELGELRRDPRGTTEIDMREIDNWVDAKHGIVRWNGYSCDLLWVEGFNAEVFIA